MLSREVYLVGCIAPTAKKINHGQINTITGRKIQPMTRLASNNSKPSIIGTKLCSNASKVHVPYKYLKVGIILDSICTSLALKLMDLLNFTKSKSIY